MTFFEYLKSKKASFFKKWGKVSVACAFLFCIFSLISKEKGFAYWNSNALVSFIFATVLYLIGIKLSCSHDWKVYRAEVYTDILEGYIVLIVFCGNCFTLRGFGGYEVNTKNTTFAAEHEFRMFLLKNKGKSWMNKLKKLLKGEKEFETIN